MQHGNKGIVLKMRLIITRPEVAGHCLRFVQDKQMASFNCQSVH